ncbi:MAG: hypothetical protein JJU44_09585 [Planctomycetes bacterium]|nr:hypothetical protein [Planctomycetota bacterium]
MKRSRSESSRRAVFVMGTMAVAGALIWSKLRLATDLPRSAYAVPEPASVEPDPNEPEAEQGLIGPERD